MEAEKKLRVAPKAKPEVAQEKKDPVGFLIPVQLFNDIVNYITRAPWMEVDGLMSSIRANAQPIFPQKPKEVENEAENQEPSNS